MGRNRIKCFIVALILYIIIEAQFIVVGSYCVAGCNFSMYRVES